MLKRRLGRLDYMGSVVMFGAASLGEVTQAQADQSIAYAIEHGVNHFDTAASYGDAELRMGPWMPKVQDQIFLATKTGERSKEKAKEEIYNSLKRLQVEKVNLIQLHAVGTIDELDQCTQKGGALEAAIEAKEEGLVDAIGITGHGHLAPFTHLEALKRFPFDTVLTPFNYYLYSMPKYKEDFDALVEETLKQDVALRVIKAIAKGPWKEIGNQKYATWYEPFDEQKIIDACVHFVLSHKGISAFASAGDIHLFPKIIDSVLRFGDMTDDEALNILSSIPDYSTPFEK